MPPMTGAVLDLEPDRTTASPRARPAVVVGEPVVIDPGDDGWRRYLRPLAVFAVSRVYVLVIAMVTAWTSSGDPGRGPWPRLPTGDALLGTLGRWDGAWYVQLATNGYPGVGATARELKYVAFYPVLPGMIRGLSDATGLNPVLAGVVIGTLTGALAILVVWELTRRFADRAAADRAAALVSFFPASFVFLMPYTEGLAIAAAGGALLAAHRRHWVTAGLLAAAATAVRPSTVAIVPALLVAAWLGRRDGWRPWAAPALGATGVVAVWLGFWAHTGRPAAWLDAEKYGWQDMTDFGRTTLHRVADFVTSGQVSLASRGLVPLAVTFGVLVGAAGVAALVIWRPPWPVIVYAVLALGMAVSSSVIGPRPRMLLGAFPLIMALAVVVSGRAFAWMIGASTVLLGLSCWVTFSGIALAP
jgi:hypothetical protein